MHLPRYSCVFACRRVWALSKKLDQLVQRRGIEILQLEIPPRQELVVTVRLSEMQRHLYNAALDRVPTGNHKMRLFAKVAIPGRGRLGRNMVCCFGRNVG